MAFDESLMLYSGVIPSYINQIMKVGIPNKWIIYGTLVLFWVDDDVLKKYTDKASVINEITTLWDDKNIRYKTWNNSW